MEKNKKLLSFINAIDDEAKKKSDEINTQTNKYLDKRLDIAAKDAKDEAKRKIETVSALIARESGRELAHEQSTVRNEIYTHRKILETKVFERAKKKIFDFCKTDKYKQFIYASAKNISSYFSNEDEIEIHVSQNDIGISDIITSAFSSKFKIISDDSIKIGGIKVCSERRKLIFDDTLDLRLENMKKDFLGIHEFIIE